MIEDASRSGANDRALSPRTLAVQAMGSIDPITKAIVMPLHMATTYVRDPDNQYRSGFSYGRPHNATVREAEAVLATLEGAAGALLFGSGMAAISAVFQAFEAGDHIVAPEVTYTGSRNWLRDEAKRRGITFARVDTSDLKILKKAVEAGPTKLVWLETPGNPLWTITDIAAAAKIAHAAGAKLAVNFDRRDTGADQSARARRRHRDAFGDQIPQRPFGCDRWRARLREARQPLRAARSDPHDLWRRARALRGLFAHPGHAHPAFARRGAVPNRDVSRREAFGERRGHARSLSRSPVSPQPRGGTPPDARRFLGHAFDRGAGQQKRAPSPRRPASRCGSARPRSAASRA